jgi:hypothetical protein
MACGLGERTCRNLKKLAQFWLLDGVREFATMVAQRQFRRFCKNRCLQLLGKQGTGVKLYESTYRYKEKDKLSIYRDDESKELSISAVCVRVWQAY